MIDAISSFLALLLILNKEYFQFSTAVVVDYEMSPAMVSGDFLIFQNLTHPGVDDIVKFRVPFYPNGKNVSLAHRVISVPKENCFVTKADNHSSSDNERFYKECVPRSAISGVLMTQIKWVGVPFLFVITLVGEEGVAAACLLLLFLLYGYNAIFRGVALIRSILW